MLVEYFLLDFLRIILQYFFSCYTRTGCIFNTFCKMKYYYKLDYNRYSSIEILTSDGVDFNRSFLKEMTL